jgi:uncharacterized protein (TIGR02246 family)
MTSSTTITMPSTDESAVRALLRDLYTAWANNDADAFAALYVEDATVVMPGVFTKGKEQVREYMATGFAGPLKDSRATDEPKSIRFLGDDAAVVVSEGGIVMAGETAVPVGRRVRATWTLVKRDGQWLIAGYHNCPAS